MPNTYANTLSERFQFIGVNNYACLYMCAICKDSAFVETPIPEEGERDAEDWPPTMKSV
jgi:hypothetical protein